MSLAILCRRLPPTRCCSLRASSWIYLMATVLGCGYQGEEVLLCLIHCHITTTGSCISPLYTPQIWYITRGTCIMLPAHPLAPSHNSVLHHYLVLTSLSSYRPTAAWRSCQSRSTRWSSRCPLPPHGRQVRWRYTHRRWPSRSMGWAAARRCGSASSAGGPRCAGPCTPRIRATPDGTHLKHFHWHLLKGVLDIYAISCCSWPLLPQPAVSVLTCLMPSRFFFRLREPMLRDQFGAPALPPGVCASISHKDQIAVALVCKGQTHRSSAFHHTRGVHT